MFSALCQKRLCFWKYRKWGYHLKNCYRKNIYAKMVENARINFSVCPYHILFFSRKENLKSFEVALAVVLCNDVLAVLWICDAIAIEILLIPYWTFTCFLWNGHKNTQTRSNICSNLSSVLQQLTFVLVVIFINLEHLSWPTLVLLFKLWKGKYWLEVRGKLFVKNKTAMLTYTHISSSLINSKIVLWSRHTSFNLTSIEIEKLFP